jgi:hypothetical protein
MNILDFIPNEAIRFNARKYLGARANINGIIYISVVKIIIPWILFYISEQIVGYKSRFRPFLYVYILIAMISIFLGPFYRFANYITPIYYLFLANMLHELFRYPPIRKFRYTIVFLIFLLPFSVHLLTIGSSRSSMVKGTRLYTIWYPYHTVFTRKTDIKREQLIQAIGKQNDLIRVSK